MAVEEGEEAKQSIATLTEYLWSIIYMPSSLRVLCLTNLFCWMSLVCYSLYFTDYVGEAVFGGNPAVSSEADSLISEVPSLQRQCIKAKSHEIQNKSLSLIYAP